MLKFLREGDNGVLIGPPGTGKSPVAKAIAYSAVRQGYRAPYAEADLLVLDDLFLARRIGPEAADQLEALAHKRYKHRLSTLITSNRIISDRDKYLGDAALTTTILDRCTAPCSSCSPVKAIG